MNTERIVGEFPAPSFRGKQEEALRRIAAAFDAGNDVVLVRAPTGSGKSLLARAVMGAARRAGEADPAEPVGAYYTTPQVAQLDAVEADDLLPDLAVVRGKSNYGCILPGEETTVDRAPCARDRDFDCEIQHRCPYFSDRSIAANRRHAAMTLAYFMQTADAGTFGTRDVVVIDEAHGLAEWAETYATIELNARTVPVWDEVSVPDLDTTRDAVLFAESLADACRRRLEALRRERDLAPEEAAERDRLAERVRELDWFVADAGDLDGATEWLLDTGGEGVTFTPLNPARYLHHTVWDRGRKFALLSATILDKEGFCRGVGLDPADVALVDVGHTFPLDNRPLYDVAQGPMTYERRDETIPDVARLLVRLMARHPDEKGLVHAHSYGIQGRLLERLDDMGVGPRVRAHGSDDREAALEAWLGADEPEVFLAVTMEEALDLEGDLARWQVLCKAPFPNTNDPRVAHRLEEGRWDWYNRAALRTVIQACGRIVRSREDYGATYLADSSLLDLFERARGAMPPWFGAAVRTMSTPDLPAFDPDAALDAYGGTRAGRAAHGDGRASRPDRGDGRASRPDRGDGRTARSGRDGGRAAPGGPTPGPSGGEGDDEGLPEDHPLHDVWGE